jgi:AraC family transcriptional regulator, regulatory protein of adaptative response / DNA-3-methyladenine glycosylase II
VDLSHDDWYRALAARDARFDGRLFVGVRTTGIYCRPICPARTPKQANVTFFTSAAAAQEAGFRPCLRCRPEVAPHLPAWNGTSATVSRALRLIDDGALEEGSIEHLAERLGTGARQLRRLFARHLGASPHSIVETRRVLLAKQLIQDTRLPMALIAHASGFGSVRRFKQTFRELFARPPLKLRQARTMGAAASLGYGVVVRLPYAAPYAWDAMLEFLGRRAIPGVEHVSGDSYARSISVGGEHGVIRIEPGRPGELALRVHVARVDVLPAIVNRVRRMFDVESDPLAISAHLGADRLLRPLVEARPGLRLAGAWAGFELAVRAILGQQITVAAARELARRLVARLGDPLPPHLCGLTPAVTRLFPTPARIAAADPSSFGMPRARAAAVIALAQATDLEPRIFGPRRSLEDAVSALRELPGIGDWTAQYIAMRELREPDAFPAGDVALQRALEALAGRPFTRTQILARAERWRPWRAYGAVHLWASLGVSRMQDLDRTHVA